MNSTTFPALSIRDLDMAYGETRVLEGIDLELPQGEVLALLGGIRIRQDLTTSPGGRLADARPTPS